MNNNVGLRIKDTRERKNISQDAMAMELDITQSNYGRLEKSDSRLTVPKLLKIAEVLEVSIAYLFDEKSSKAIHQHNNQSAQAYNVDTIESVINADKDHINSLKEEINYLRDLLKEKI
jgi:transcriptional regulator with XRE-family HTH domain